MTGVQTCALPIYIKAPRWKTQGNRLRLILRSWVMAPGSCDQGCDECPEKGFSAFAHIMNELEEPKVEGQLLL